MSLEYHMECIRESNKESVFRRSNVEDELSLAANIIWQQYGH